MNTIVRRKPASLLDEFFTGAVRHHGGGTRRTTGFEIAVKKNDEEYRIVAHLPGVKKEDLTVELKDGVLTIAGKAEQVRDEEYRTVYSELRDRTEFKRQIKVDSSRFVVENVAAKIENGVLEVVLPVKPEEQAKQIEIK